MSDKGKDDDYVALAMGGVAVIALIVLAILPTVLAFTLWVFFRDFLSRRDYVLIFTIGLVVWVVSLVDTGYSYLSWMWNSVRGNIDIWAFPWLAVVATAAIILGAFGFLTGTRIAERLPGALRHRVPTERETILPTADEKQRASSVVSAPGGIVVAPTQKKTAAPSPAAPGKRRFTVAVDAEGTPVTIGEDEIRTHAMVLGATGSGKTEAIKVLAGGLLDLGWSGMILDLKEDVAPGGLRDWCATYAQHHSRPYQELRLSNPNSPMWFNPLSGMGPDEIRDTILTLQEFDDAFWQALNKELLGQVVNLFYWAHQADPSQFPMPSMYDMGKLLGAGDLKTSTKKMRAVVQDTIPGVTAEDFRALANPSPDMQKSAIGYGSKLTQIYDTQAGRSVLRPGSGEKRIIDVTQEGLTYVGLDSQGKADLTKVVSSAMLQRMSVYAAQRVTGQAAVNPVAPRFLIVDEANWVNRTIVQNLLSRARSAGIAMVLCTQGPKDWVDEQGDDWGKLTQNVNVSVIMSQGEPESAEMCADYIGKDYKKQRSETVRQARGLIFNKPMRDAHGDIVESHSIREELTHIVDPDELRRMGVGEAILRVGKPSERITWMRMFMRDPRDTLERP